MMLYTCAFLLAVTHATAVTEWELLAHSNTRSTFGLSDSKGLNGSSPAVGAGWSGNTDAKYNLPTWAVPFAFGPTLAGGINQRASDGAIHVQLLGTRVIDLGPENGGAVKMYAPPYVWEVAAETGGTNKMYDLSQYGDTFYSVIRYTPSGNPVVAVCDDNEVGKITLVVLDKGSTTVLWSFKPSLEPMLLATTNTDPAALIYAGMTSLGSLAFDTAGDMPSTDEVVNEEFSAIIFGTSGQELYNNGWVQEETGVYRLALPLTGNSHPVDAVPGCEVFQPWLIVSDSQGIVYVPCDDNYHLSAYGPGGKKIWQSEFGEPEWVTIDDAETVVMIGGADYWGGIDLATGHTLYNTTLKELAPDGGVVCTYSAQPWAPRHPIPTADGRLAILCMAADGKAWDVRTISATTGKVTGAPVALSVSPVQMLTADSAGFVYAWGNNTSGQVVGQRVALPSA